MDETLIKNLWSQALCETKLNGDPVIAFARLIENTLNKTPKTLNPGVVLDDGCVVIDVIGSEALIAAPKDTEVICEWSLNFKPAFNKLKEKGFNPIEWFIPSENQLLLAYRKANHHFWPSIYWSSTEADSFTGRRLDFGDAIHGSVSKKNNYYVRAFRYIELP